MTTQTENTVAETQPEKNELVDVIQTSGLEKQTETTLLESFLPFFKQANEWKQKANALVVTDVSQKHEMQMARTARLALREIRINADKKRKELKEDSLRYGKAVQGVYNVIEYLVSPIESHLEQQEKFPEIQAAKKMAELQESRSLEVQPYAEYVPYGLNLGAMAEDQYNKILAGAKLQHEKKIEEDKKIEQERIAALEIERKHQERKEKLLPYWEHVPQGFKSLNMGMATEVEFNSVLEDAKQTQQKVAEEQEKMKVENERLRIEAEQKQKELIAAQQKAEQERKVAEEKARKEREASEAILLAERKAAEEKLRQEQEQARKLAQELQAKKDAEEAQMKARVAAEKKAAAAPDKAKLAELAAKIQSIEMPSLKSAEAVKIAANAKELLDKVAAYINKNTEAL